MLEKNDNRVVATFSDILAARAAVEELKTAGFTDNQIRIVENEFMEEENDTELGDVAPRRQQHQQGFFARLFGIDEGYDDRYHEEIARDPYIAQTYRQGQQVVMVDANMRHTEAVEILRHAGGTIEEGMLNAFNERLDQVRTILLREEQMHVSKDTVNLEDVRVRKEVVTETKTIEVPVSREELVIERRPVSGQEVAASSEAINASDLGDHDEVRIQLSEEQVQVEKRTVPREEVRIGKKRVQEVRKVTEDLKREEARIERDEPVTRGPLHGNIDEERRTS